MFSNTISLAYAVLFCLVSPVLLYMVLPIEKAKQKLEQDRLGYIFVFVGFVLTMVGYFLFTKYVLAFGAVGLFIIGLGVLYALPPKPTAFILKKVNLIWAAALYGIYLFIHYGWKVIQPLGTPFLKLLVALWDDAWQTWLMVSKSFILFYNSLTVDQTYVLKFVLGMAMVVVSTIILFVVYRKKKV